LAWAGRIFAGSLPRGWCAVRAAVAAYQPWSRATAKERARLLRRLGDLLEREETVELASVIAEAGFAPGVVNVVTGLGEGAGAALVRHPEVAKIAFTGSSATGQAVMRGAAEHLARVSLELGGKSPNVIFDDADLFNAVSGVLAGVFAATGQTCMAGSRVLLQDTIYDDFAARLVERTKAIRLGDPLGVWVDTGNIIEDPFRVL